MPLHQATVYKGQEVSCAHPHLKFEDGDNKIRCMDCPWEAKTASPGVPDPMLSIDGTRHSKWELPRSEPVTKK